MRNRRQHGRRGRIGTSPSQVAHADIQKQQRSGQSHDGPCTSDAAAAATAADAVAADAAALATSEQVCYKKIGNVWEISVRQSGQ